MTRLEQALRWWRNPANEGSENVPTRHVKALLKAGLVRTRGPDDRLHETRAMRPEASRTPSSGGD